MTYVQITIFVCLFSLRMLSLYAHEEILSNEFKRDPASPFCEHLSFVQGQAFLNVIQEETPSILSLCDQFRLNDAFGNPYIYDYGQIGNFSPTTLQYMKIAGDLQKEFGEALSNMHIVEIGGDYGGLCKIIADLCGFASYTIIHDTPHINGIRQYLKVFDVDGVDYISHESFESSGPYDLVISPYTFLTLDQTLQKVYMKKIFHETPNGYIILNSELPTSYSAEEVIKVVFRAGITGTLETTRPLLTKGDQKLLWKQMGERSLSTLTGKNIAQTPCENGARAVTYDFSGGRFGDNLLAYFHAKWIAFKYGMVFLYKPFKYAETLKLSQMDLPFDNYSFRQSMVTSNGQQIANAPPSTLITIPYFPECLNEYARPYMRDAHNFSVDWDDPEFHKEIVECLTPKSHVDTVDLPDGFITVAVHVRRGGDYEPYAHCGRVMPLKFPPDSYYISQIKRIATIFHETPLYVHIFTDDHNPQEILQRYQESIQNPNILFATEKSDMFKDFFSMGRFDCIIRCMSNFSIMASLLGDYQMIITPTHALVQPNEVLVDQVEIIFKGKRL